MEWTRGSIRYWGTEDFECLLLRGCGEREERQVFLEALRTQFFSDLLINLKLFCLNLGFSSRIAFQQVLLRILTRSGSIGKNLFEFLRCLACLRRMCLVHNHREPFSGGGDLTDINKRELLQRRDNDFRPVSKSLGQLAGVLINLDHHTSGVIHRVDRILELLIQYTTVSDHDD